MKINVTEAVMYEKKVFAELKIGTFFKRTKENGTGWYEKVSETEVYNDVGDSFDYNAIWFGRDTPLLDRVAEGEVVEVANEVNFIIQ